MAAFEPRTNTSRRKIFQKPYAQAFHDADLILVREPPDLWKVDPGNSSSSRELVANLQGQGQEARFFPDTDALLEGLLHSLRPGDVVLVMSNGDFNHLVPRLCEAFGGRGPEPLSPCLNGSHTLKGPSAGAPCVLPGSGPGDYRLKQMSAQWTYFFRGDLCVPPEGAPPQLEFHVSPLYFDRNPV